MNTRELKESLSLLICRYVGDDAKKSELLALIDDEQNIPVKGVVSDLTPYLSGVIDVADSKILKDICFYFC